MILLENSIIRLDYEPATDILEVDYPDLHDSQLSEIRYSFKLMVETIRNYDVKRLLLDGSKTAIEVSDDENRELTMQFAADLVKTRLEKVARIQPIDKTREMKAQENINEIKQAGLLPYQVKTFTNRAEAKAWLKGNAN